MMTDHHVSHAEANCRLGRHFFESQDRLRGGPDPSLCAAHYTATIGGNPPFDWAGHERFAVGFFHAFPDGNHEYEEIFATEDRIAVRFVIRGTHTGSFFGIPPTGKSVVVKANVLMKVADGNVTSLFGIFDEAGLLRQIGVLP